MATGARPGNLKLRLENAAEGNRFRFLGIGLKDPLGRLQGNSINA